MQVKPLDNVRIGKLETLELYIYTTNKHLFYEEPERILPTLPFSRYRPLYGTLHLISLEYVWRTQ